MLALLCRLTWEPILCTSSSLKDKSELVRTLGLLGSSAKLINGWNKAVTHVVMTEIILTIKVKVTVKYLWDAFRQSRSLR